MSYESCSRCGRYGWTDSHRCSPRWKVWLIEDGETEEDASLFHALDAEEAAEKWAEDYDCNSSYHICGGQSVYVYVKSEDADEDDLPQRFKVTGETVPSYSAHEAEVKDLVVPDERWILSLVLHQAWEIKWERQRAKG